MSHCRQLEHAGFEVGNVCAFLDTALCRRLPILMFADIFGHPMRWLRRLLLVLLFVRLWISRLYTVLHHASVCVRDVCVSRAQRQRIAGPLPISSRRFPEASCGLCPMPYNQKDSPTKPQCQRRAPESSLPTSSKRARRWQSTAPSPDGKSG